MELFDDETCDTRKGEIFYHIGAKLFLIIFFFNSDYNDIYPDTISI